MARFGEGFEAEVFEILTKLALNRSSKTSNVHLVVLACNICPDPAVEVDHLAAGIPQRCSRMAAVVGGHKGSLAAT